MKLKIHLKLFHLYSATSVCILFTVSFVLVTFSIRFYVFSFPFIIQIYIYILCNNIHLTVCSIHIYTWSCLILDCVLTVSLHLLFFYQPFFPFSPICLFNILQNTPSSTQNVVAEITLCQHNTSSKNHKIIYQNSCLFF